MIQITPQMRVLVAVAAIDFRRGIDGLARVCRESLGADPFSGTILVFRSNWGTPSAASNASTSSYIWFMAPWMSPHGRR